ncbi:uncharacterized protein LOC111366657 [Olea europaea var. sylvestris]|uniref:uncharacterized protein LOC111366657 n=1 Tax=Olea europaea var. sylvestris TaxID=158386 RepID=UPI000C1D6606|nr:uncharacterized protein LOC111366657 [Olea europaea var. sylvestris]
MGIGGATRRFERSKSEPTLYLKRHGKIDLLIICLYVDDIIYMGYSSSLIDEFKEHMKNKFEMSDLILLRYFLGLEVKLVEDGVFVSQRKYATYLPKIFNMPNCIVATTPLNLNEKPNIAFSVGMISRFMHCPSKIHLGVAKRVLSYIAGTIDFVLRCNFISMSSHMITKATFRP